LLPVPDKPSWHILETVCEKMLDLQAIRKGNTIRSMSESNKKQASSVKRPSVPFCAKSDCYNTFAVKTRIPYVQGKTTFSSVHMVIFACVQWCKKYKDMIVIMPATVPLSSTKARCTTIRSSKINWSSVWPMKWLDTMKKRFFNLYIQMICQTTRDELMLELPDFNVDTFDTRGW
jgi:hypothetical protein